MLDIQRDGKSISSKTTEFNFCEENGTKNYVEHMDLERSHIDFQTEKSEHVAYSPTFWATSTRHEASTLLTHNPHYSFQSPTSRLQVMVDDRRSLTKVVQNVPELSFELSLTDIVDVRTNMQEVGEDAKNNSGKRRKCLKRTKMLRSQSMDSGVFLLKMFFPACLSPKKKAISGNCSKASPRPSFDGSEKPWDKEWWSVKFLVSWKNKNSCSSGSTTCINSSNNRNGDNSFPPDYLSSDNFGNSRRHIWCLF